MFFFIFASSSLSCPLLQVPQSQWQMASVVFSYSPFGSWKGPKGILFLQEFLC